MTRISRSYLVTFALTACALALVTTGGCNRGPGSMTEEPPIVEEPPPDNTAGIAWTQVRTGGGLQSPAGTTGEPIRSVAWGGGRFVAVGDGGTIVHSTDGATWTAASATAPEEILTGVAWGGGRFVAVALSGTVVHSADGVSWESASEAGYRRRGAVYRLPMAVVAFSRSGAMARLPTAPMGITGRRRT